MEITVQDLKVIYFNVGDERIHYEWRVSAGTLSEISYLKDVNNERILSIDIDNGNCFMFRCPVIVMDRMKYGDIVFCNPDHWKYKRELRIQDQRNKYNEIKK